MGLDTKVLLFLQNVEDVALAIEFADALSSSHNVHLLAKLSPDVRVMPNVIVDEKTNDWHPDHENENALHLDQWREALEQARPSQIIALSVVLMTRTGPHATLAVTTCIAPRTFRVEFLDSGGYFKSWMPLTDLIVQAGKDLLPTGFAIAPGGSVPSGHSRKCVQGASGLCQTWVWLLLDVYSRLGTQTATLENVLASPPRVRNEMLAEYLCLIKDTFSEEEFVFNDQRESFSTEAHELRAALGIVPARASARNRGAR